MQSLFINSNNQLLRYRKTLFILIVFTISWLYHSTSILVDWSDIRNWEFKKRNLPLKLYNLPKYEKYPGLDCSEFSKENSANFQKYREWGRIVVQDFDHLPMDCSSIRWRIMGNLSFPVVENSYAISRVIYEDYFWQETVLSQTYSSQNFYCYSIDSKSPQVFYNSIKQLSKCLPNVIVAEPRYNFDSDGHFLNYGHFDCSELLIQLDGWKYILWAQNHDLILRTNEEMSQIIRFLNGSHGIGHKPAQWKRYNFINDWTVSSLNLWKYPEKRTENQRNAVLSFSQNYNEVFLSRVLIEFVIREMNYRNLLNALEVPYRFATDELFWATLIATEELELPGSPKSPCPDNRFYMTRYNEWEKWYNLPCKSGFSRHGTCIFGMEYLPLFTQLHQICVNKVMPDFDYGFIKCYGQVLFERTFNHNKSPDNFSIYSGDSRVKVSSLLTSF